MNSLLEDALYEYTFIIYSTGWSVRLCIKVKQCQLQTVNFYCLYATHTAYKDGRFVLQHKPQWTQVSSHWEASSFHITQNLRCNMCDGSSDTCLNITNVYGHSLKFFTNPRANKSFIKSNKSGSHMICPQQPHLFVAECVVKERKDLYD